MRGLPGLCGYLPHPCDRDAAQDREDRCQGLMAFFITSIMPRKSHEKKELAAI